MIEATWVEIAVEVGVAAISGIGSAWLTAYRMGRKEATKESDVKHSIDAVKTELGEKLNDVKNDIEEKVEQNTQQFAETFNGLRQKINDVELNTERRFLQKDEFEDFRKEYREDQHRTDNKLDILLTRQASIMQSGR